MKIGLAEHLRDLHIPPVLDGQGQWVHCQNAKTGTTSINEGVFGRERCVIRHRDPSKWKRVWEEIIAPNLDNLVLFTSVRNPWDRIYSAVTHCQTHASHPKNKVDPAWEFTDYVKEVLAVEGPLINKHFVPQYETVRFEGEPIPGMFIGRFERLHEDWARLAEMLGVRKDLPHRNRRSHPHYVEQYDDESREIVGRLYRKEIKALGYRFGS